MTQSYEEKVIAARTRMAELAAKFVDRSAGEIPGLRENIAKSVAGDSAAIAEVRNVSHRMCGTGATLGFERLSDCALRIEKLADRCEAGDAMDVDAGKHLSVALDALESEIARLKRSAVA